MAMGLPMVLLGLALLGQPATLPPIIPQPQEYVRKSGEFEILPSTVIVAGAGELAEAEKFAAMLRRSTGYPLPIQPAKPAKDYIEFELKPEMKWLGGEGYRVSIRPGFASIRSFAADGLFHGIQTFRQLLPVAVESGEPVYAPWKVPAVEISDTPRFGWRGMHLDESRHFFGKAAVEKFIDVLALYKFNRFHWHLVDDGGWRLEIKKYPDLTRVGAWRIGDGRGFNPAELFFNQNDGVYEVYGGFYTQEEVKEVVAYAAERHIEVIPEIEMPSHCLPALWAYRQLACDSESVNKVLPSLRTQFVNTFCPGKEETMSFITGVLDEVCALFPSREIHIGGDEPDLRTWESCRSCQSLRERNQLSGVEAEYGWFMRQVSGYLKSKGRTPVAWDESIDSGPIPGLTVMSWRGISGAVSAVKAGLPAVLAPQDTAYFDRSESITSTENVYAFDPMPPGLTAGQQALIRGGQGQLWTERLNDWRAVEQAAFPRVLALSEALWSDTKTKDWGRFESGLGSHIARLDAMGIQSHIERPKLGPVMVAFRERISVDPPETPPGMTLRRTLDGSAPTPSSEVYDGPFAVAASTTLKAAFQRGGGPMGEATTVEYVLVGPARAGLQPGLWADWHRGRFRSVDGFADPTERGQVPTWANQWRYLAEPLGAKFSGYLRIPADGDYTFYLRSDDGSRLTLAGVQLIDLPNVGVAQASQATARLVKGDYPFELSYFDMGGNRELLWEVEAKGFRRRSVPTEWLFRDR